MQLIHTINAVKIFNDNKQIDTSTTASSNDAIINKVIRMEVVGHKRVHKAHFTGQKRIKIS